MGKQKIIGLIVMMSVVLGLLVLLQMNTIGNAANIREEQFSQLVKQCLINVAKKLEDIETREILQAEDLIKQSSFTPINENISDVIIHQEINYSVLKKNKDGEYIESSIQKDTVIRLTPPVQNQESFNNIDQRNNIEHERRLKNIKERDLYMRRLQLHMEMASRPIEERVQQDYLETLLKNEFANHGILLDFEYAVKSFPFGEEKTIFTSEEYKNSKRTEHRIPLYASDIREQKANYLNVYFPKSRRQFLMSTGIMVIPSILLIIVIIGIFTYTIMIILRQKKLSVVKNDFINNMTHELKTPISTISLASQMLRDNSVNHTTVAVDRISNVIYDESKRLSMQVEKVLQMAVFNEGRLKMKFKTIDIHEIITSVVQNFEIRVQTEDGHLTLHKNASKCLVHGDQVHITNVLFNLLDNAMKYKKGIPEIEITTQNKKNFLVISIKDNGIGIAKEHQKQIFERFYRVPTGNVHDVKGFGLGLHYVYKVISTHNGEIKVESAINKGTNFILHIPVKE